MIKRSLVKFLTLLILALTMCSTQVFAGITNVQNNSKNYVQPKENAIQGESANFTFVMPVAWRDKVNVYRQAGEVGDSFLEKLSFYYSPNKSSTSLNRSTESLFLTITLYASGQKIQSSSETVLFTEKGYTFTSLVNTQNNYKDVATKNEFNKIVVNCKDKDYLKKYIYFNDSRVVSSASSIYYRNTNNTGKSYIDSNGIIYVPLREFADNMNYSVTWYSSINGCRVTKNGISDIVYAKSNSAYVTKSINGRLYVSTKYLQDKWNVNIYIDSKANVYIS